MTMFSGASIKLGERHNPPLPGYYGNMQFYWDQLQDLAGQYRKRAEKRQKQAVKYVKGEARAKKGEMLARLVGSGLSTSTATNAAIAAADRYKSQAVASIMSQPPQYEQDPFYNATLQQWLMANQALMQKGTRPKTDNTGAWAGLGGQLGGALIGAIALAVVMVIAIALFAMYKRRSEP